MNQLQREGLIGTEEAAREIPGGSSSETIRRWITGGCRGYRLEAIRSGNRYFTSKQAVTRFLAKLNQDLVAVAD